MFWLKKMTIKVGEEYWIKYGSKIERCRIKGIGDKFVFFELRDPSLEWFGNFGLAHREFGRLAKRYDPGPERSDVTSMDEATFGV